MSFPLFPAARIGHLVRSEFPKGFIHLLQKIQILEAILIEEDCSGKVVLVELAC